MRVYITTTVPEARQIMAQGFRDLYTLGEAEGVWAAREPLGANDGFAGNVVLAVTVPDELFTSHELIESGVPDQESYEVRTGRALIPADVLNRHGPAQVYDHEFAGLSRRELVNAIRQWEEGGQAGEHIAAMRAAMEFFDEIGWRTPLKYQEQPGA